MFGFSLREKATAAATQGALQMLRLRENSPHGLPSGFWRDPYPIGFFYGAIGMFAKIATNRRIGGEQLGMAAYQTFVNLLGSQGVEVARLATNYYLDQDPVFIRGCDNGQKVVVYTTGLSDLDDDPDIITARIDGLKYIAAALDLGGSASSRSLTAQALLERFLFADVDERFGLTA